MGFAGCPLPSPASGQSSGRKDWSWGLGEAWGGTMCGKRGRNHLLTGLRCLHEGAWLCPWETKWL